MIICKVGVFNGQEDWECVRRKRRSERGRGREDSYVWCKSEKRGKLNEKEEDEDGHEEIEEEEEKVKK